ncbi:MAG: DegT/DnrJ/EryC1/StrS family aminotransferase [Stagnimonas sp.]|nr:DegT/DnrJ/EryC1/StrS family aminotransferase [Stagnimonas sp.]
MSAKYPLATATWDAAEYAAISKVVGSGMFTMGQQVAEFEKLFAQFQGSKYAVMVNSGSSANLLMIAALRFTSNSQYKLEPGDEVIVPAVSWATTYYPLAQYGLKQKFVDIDAETLNYDLESLSKAITEKTRAIMVVNLLGNPNDFSVINKLIAGRNIIVVEDNCESLGAEFNGKKAGSFGLMGTFSSFFSHHISTMEGGVITTDDEELYHVLLSLRAHGWTRNLPKYNKVTGVKSDDAFEESFRFVLPGYNVRPLEMSGAIGIEQIKKLPMIVRERRKNGNLIQEKMAKHPFLTIQKEIGKSSWFGFSLLLKPDAGFSRRELVGKLEAIGFECRPIVGGNFARNPVLTHMQHEIFGQLKNADYIDAYGLFVGNHHYPISEAIDILASLK